MIRALGNCRARPAATRLRDLYLECGPHEQFQIIWALLRISPPWLADFLLRRLEEPDLDMRRAAAQGLAEAAGPSTWRCCSALADDADWDIRNSAARGLGRHGDAGGRATLLTLARDVESVVAATARAALDPTVPRA